jgi:hypothetical protein
VCFNQSDGGVVNIFRASINQKAKWGIFSGNLVDYVHDVGVKVKVYGRCRLKGIPRDLDEDVWTSDHVSRTGFPFRKHSGNIQGLFREHSGKTQGISSVVRFDILHPRKGAYSSSWPIGHITSIFILDE